MSRVQPRDGFGPRKGTMVTAKRTLALALAAGLVAAVPIAGKVSRGDSIASATAAPASLATPPVFEDAERVEQLIEALGSQRYVDRREAEQQLLESGMPAFDQIDAATDHPDPEISASCRFLVSELTVRWTRRDDPPEVKAALADYAAEDESRRLAVVAALGGRADRWAIAPLCRICRYDAAPVVARQAAIELLRAADYPLEYTAEDAQTLRQEIGSSVRPHAVWVRLLAAQIDNPRGDFRSVVGGYRPGGGRGGRRPRQSGPRVAGGGVAAKYGAYRTRQRIGRGTRLVDRSLARATERRCCRRTRPFARLGAEGQPAASHRFVAESL